MWLSNARISWSTYDIKSEIEPDDDCNTMFLFTISYRMYLIRPLSPPLTLSFFTKLQSAHDRYSIPRAKVFYAFRKLFQMLTNHLEIEMVSVALSKRTQIYTNIGYTSVYSPPPHFKHRVIPIHNYRFISIWYSSENIFYPFFVK